MAQLTLKDFRCEVDTDEMGDESPYFVTWIGDLTIEDCITKLSRKAFWENKVSPGPSWPVNDVVNTRPFHLVPAKTLVLAAMIEEDEGTDLPKPEAEDINTAMLAVFRVHAARHPSSNEALLVSTMRNTLRSEILKHMSPAIGADDDLMEEDGHHAVRQVVLPSQGGIVEVTFKGGNGIYRARYTVS